MDASRTTRARVGRAGVLLTAVAVLCMHGASPRAAGPVVDDDPQPLARIASGTRIGNGPPQDWTHLVFKSRTELKSGDLDELRETAIPLARLLFTAMVARVGADGRVFQLREVAIGLGTKIGQQDVIITGPTQEALGADFGWFEQMVLSGAERQVDQSRRVARSGTMAIVDLHTIMVVGGRHRAVVLRHLLLVHPQSGGLATVVWRIDLDSDGAYRSASGEAVVQMPNLIETCPLHVDGEALIFGVPTAEAFAAERMPSGRPVPMPALLRKTAGQEKLTPTTARQIEAAFRDAIALSGGA